MIRIAECQVMVCKKLNGGTSTQCATIILKGEPAAFYFVASGALLR